jgi:CheY-like chemotaxis protein
MILLWETKDAYAYSFKKKEESKLRLNAYSDFLLKKNKDVRSAVHNVKGTGEMILRYNASDISAGHVMDVMEASDKIVELVDGILETSRAELYNKNSPSHEHREEEVASYEHDGTYLYAPGAYVLVADDSAETLNLARVLLARTKMRIDTVLTGSEALKMISYNYYNLIVLDNVLSDMSAVEIMRAIKEGNGVNADTPVIVCTAADNDEVRDMYLGEGFADVVRKPLSGGQIERITEKYLPARLVSRRETL